MRPDEGIDKIGVLLNPVFLNMECKIKNIDPYNRLSFHNAGSFKVLVIKQEYLNPLLDHQMQISFAIYELVKKGIINFPDNFFTPLFIYNNYKWFVLNIVAIEFYSSWSPDEIDIDEDMVEKNIDAAKENGCLYRYVDKEKNELTDTYYSNDKAKKSYDRSSFIIYNKQNKDIKDNQIPTDVILSNPKTIRTEFRLYSDNTDWLHWDNLKGDYQTIFNRHINLLATIYNNYLRGCFTVNSKTNKNFKKIVKVAEENDSIRYSGKRLKKRVSLNKINEYGGKNPEEKSRLGLSIFEENVMKNEKYENAETMREIMENEAKNRGKYY